LDVGGIGVRRSSLGDGARAEASERAQAVIHDNSASGRNVEGEGGGYANQMLAARGKLGGQSSALGPEHIGCPQWMRKARQIGGLIEDLDPNEAAAARQLQLGQGSPMIERHVGRGL